METIKNEYIELKDFDLLGSLEDEENALASFMNEYDSGYVCDVISEIADSHIPIYTKEIWEYAYDIQEYIEQAISEGIADVSSRDVDLTRIFQAGYYEYYTQSLYRNLDQMVFNMIADKVNEFLNANVEYADKVDLDELESEIESVSTNYDNNNKMADIEHESDRIIQAIKDEEFNQ